MMVWVGIEYSHAKDAWFTVDGFPFPARGQAWGRPHKAPWEKTQPDFDWALGGDSHCGNLWRTPQDDSKLYLADMDGAYIQPYLCEIAMNKARGAAALIRTCYSRDKACSVCSGEGRCLRCTGIPAPDGRKYSLDKATGKVCVCVCLIKIRRMSCQSVCKICHWSVSGPGGCTSGVMVLEPAVAGRRVPGILWWPTASTTHLTGPPRQMIHWRCSGPRVALQCVLGKKPS